MAKFPTVTPSPINCDKLGAPRSHPKGQLFTQPHGIPNGSRTAERDVAAAGGVFPAWLTHENANIPCLIIIPVVDLISQASALNPG